MNGHIDSHNGAEFPLPADVRAAIETEDQEKLKPPSRAKLMFVIGPLLRNGDIRQTETTRAIAKTGHFPIYRSLGVENWKPLIGRCDAVMIIDGFEKFNVCKSHLEEARFLKIPIFTYRLGNDAILEMKST